MQLRIDPWLSGKLSIAFVIRWCAGVRSPLLMPIMEGNTLESGDVAEFLKVSFVPFARNVLSPAAGKTELKSNNFARAAASALPAGRFLRHLGSRNFGRSSLKTLIEDLQLA